MEKIIKNAVSETSKVLENMVEELKAEVLRVKSENENLKIRCSQFEELLKNRSVYRETGTSPEPYIIEKCDKSVQCDLFSCQASNVNQDPLMLLLPTQEVQTDDEEQILSQDENETQDSDGSHIPFGPIYEKDCSNDSFSFLKETEHNLCCEVDASADENKTDEPLGDDSTSESVSVDKNCLDQELNNTEGTECLETQTQTSGLRNGTIFSSAQSDMDMEPETSHKISGIETQEPCQEEHLDFSQKEVHVECSKTDHLLLDCQEGENNDKEEEETNEQTNLSLRENTIVSQTEDNVNFIVPNTEQKDFVASSSSDLTSENARLPISSQQDAEDMTMVDHQQSQCSSESKNNDDSAADTTNSISDSSVHTDISSVSDQSITTLKVKEAIETPVSESQMQICTEINDSTVEPMSTAESPVKEPQNTSQLTSTSLLSIQSRHRCTSVTLEDAMLLLDAINQHKYKVSSTRTSNVDASETDPAVSVTTHIPAESINSEENAQTTQLSEQLDDSSETTQVMEADVCPANMEIEDEPAIDDMSPGLTPEKQQTAPNCDGDGQNEVNDVIPSTAAPISSPKSLGKTESDKTKNVTQTTGPATHSDDNCQQSDLDVAIAFPLEKNEPTTQPIPHIKRTIPEVTQMSSHLTRSDNGHQQKDLHKRPQTSTSNLSTPPTVLLNTPTEPDEQSSTHKTHTTPQTLSPAQLSAVLSAVRSSQNSNLPKITAPNATKRTLIAVPFSLQSVMRPHHKIIVIPRQCRAPSSQAVETTNQVIVQQKELLTTDHATGNIMSNVVTPETSSGEGDVTVPEVNAPDNMDTNQYPPLLTQPTQSLPETSALQLLVPEEEQMASLSATVTPKCKNKVQIRLRRLPFAISTAHSVSVSNISNGSSKIIIRKTAPKNLPMKAPSISPMYSRKSEAQLVTNTQAIVTKPIDIIAPSALLPSSVEMPIKNQGTMQNDKPTEVNQSSAVVQFSPIVSGDHSYPQLRMTKSQFLAQLDVSPVTQDSNKVADGKEIQKLSLVDRLRNHLAKPRLQTIRMEQNAKVGHQKCSNLDLADNKTMVTSINDKTLGLDREQLSDVAKEMSCFPDGNTHAGKDNMVSPRRSPGTKKVSDDGQIKRKTSVIDTASTFVKKPKLKGRSENENKCPIPIKILCTNALISCTKRCRSYRHAKQKMFLCKFCHKEFLKKADIETHVQMHAGKKPFQCTICAKRFSKTLELSRHLKRHERKRKYPCPTCGKLFVDHNNLKRHSYIHMATKPYSCPHCPKTFSQSCHRKSHLKNKHKNTDF